jgi:hypothetical protein
VCFSPQADLIAGIGVTAIGVDACRNIRGRSDHLLLATLPLVLGVHELVEDFVWWGLQGHVPHQAGRVALWAYMVIAFVVLPVFVPLAVLMLEPTARRRRRMAPFAALGVVVSTVLLVAMLRGPVSAARHPWHLSYSIELHHAVIIVGLYVIAICGALLFSGYRHIVVFGLGNLGVVVALAALTADGFASLWCVYAAISAGAIAPTAAPSTRSAPWATRTSSPT